MPTSPPFVAFLRNLAYDATEQDVGEFFDSCGKITRVHLPKDPKDNKPKGFGYVEFEEQEGLKAALLLDDKDFYGRSLRVAIGKRSSEDRRRNDRPGGRGGRETREWTYSEREKDREERGEEPREETNQNWREQAKERQLQREKEREASRGSDRGYGGERRGYGDRGDRGGYGGDRGDRGGYGGDRGDRRGGYRGGYGNRRDGDDDRREDEHDDRRDDREGGRRYTIVVADEVEDMTTDQEKTTAPLRGKNSNFFLAPLKIHLQLQFLQLPRNLTPSERPNQETSLLF
eukprot:TRINITY_DN1630_c0_g1_i2.p1 TRINITY_DN1630_c0_g1~~TRINITY_DN1630_c0_g1_i2.p1  ORF type:complete len:288 (-),score=75.21 TRINITY_DN1630_c0_g1_i2:513-1376(-)